MTADHLSWLGRQCEAVEPSRQVIPFLSEVWGEWHLGSIWLGALALSAHADLAEGAALHGRRSEVEAARRAGLRVMDSPRRSCAPNGQVGRSLHISPKTASMHVSNLMAKLGASGRTAVVALAYERGLLEPHDLD